MKYRIYIDECGNSDLDASTIPNHRYLNLTGVILSLEYVDRVVFPQLEELKQQYFHSHPDDPVVLHRKELVNKKPPFDVLWHAETEQKFNNALLSLLTVWDYTVISITIDKLAHKEQYHTWRFDPYHYCLEVLLERYVLWLEANDRTGDVMIESRGGKEDMRLKRSFERIWENGSDFVGAERFAKFLTSKQLKVKVKQNNISGLQIADLVAHPAYKYSLARHQGTQMKSTFGRRIAEILHRSKFNRNYTGKIEGWGTKWLP